MQPTDAIEHIKQQINHDADRVNAIRAEMKKLLVAYTKFKSLSQELGERTERMRTLIGVLGPDDFNPLDADQAIEDEIEEITFAPEELRKKLPLWKAVETFLSVAGESRVPQVQKFLDYVALGGSISRQAIESAVNRHSETFEVNTKGRERYIRLKKSK